MATQPHATPPGGSDEPEAIPVHRAQGTSDTLPDTTREAGGAAASTGSFSLPVPPALEAPPISRAARALVLLGAEGGAVAFFVWLLRARAHLVEYVAQNRLSAIGRKVALADLFGGALLAGIGGLVLAIGRRRSDGIDVLERLAYRFAPLALLAFVPLLFQWQLWTSGRELTFLVIVAGFGLLLQRATRLAFETPPAFPRFGASLRASLGTGAPASALRRLIQVRWLPSALVLVGVVAYAIYFSKITIDAHYRLATAGYDLGIENNLVWNAAHWNRPLFKTSVIGGPTSTHMGWHQTFISYLFGIPYRLAPWPQTLLALQAVLIGGAAFPLYLYARRHVGRSVACLIAFIVLFYAPLHGSNLYDFHYLPFAPFFIWTALWLLESRRDGWAALVIALTFANREDMSALLLFAGAYLVLSGERPKAGLVVAGISAIVFVGQKMILMPHLLGGYDAYVNQYQDLVPLGDRGFGGVLKTVFGNPGFTVTSLLEREKLIYLLEIVTPLAFFPWRRPIGALCTAPGFFFTLLATHYPPLNQISFQYTAYWTTFLFIAVVANLRWLNRQELQGQRWAAASRRGWLVAMTAAGLATSYQFGAVLQHNTVWGGFSPFRYGISADDRRRHDDLYALIGQIPPDATVAASELLVAQVSSRKNAYTLKLGFYGADYILVRFPISGEDRNHLLDALRTRAYGVVAERGEFALLRRGAPHETADALMRRIGG